MTHLLDAERRANDALIKSLSAERKMNIDLILLIESIYDELTNREINGNYEISLETFNKIKSVIEGIK